MDAEVVQNQVETDCHCAAGVDRRAEITGGAHDFAIGITVEPWEISIAAPEFPTNVQAMTSYGAAGCPTFQSSSLKGESI
jgi:hypothetical protein